MAVKPKKDRDAGVLVALIRGINVGRAKRVQMAELRKIVAELGYGNVKTLLNSGNVVFTDGGAGPALAAAGIERGIEARFGVTARVTVVTARELEAVIEANPLVTIADNPSRLLVGFLADAESRALVEPLLNRDWSPEALALGPGAAYLWCPQGVLACGLCDEFSRLLRDSVTSRNWGTTLKIQAAVHALRSE